MELQDVDEHLIPVGDALGIGVADVVGEVGHLLIHAGLDGIERGETLAPPCNENLFEAAVSSAESLPGSLTEALDLTETSDFVRRVLSRELVERLFAKAGGMPGACACRQ